MSKIVVVHRRGNPAVPLLRARWCESFLCRLRGLMFRHELPDGLGLVLVEENEGVTNTAIHMFAVPFAIGVLWVDDAFVVVDKVVALPWRVYFPKERARFIVEGEPKVVELVAIGDQVEFTHEA